MDASLTLQRLAIRRGSDDVIFDRALTGDPVAFSEVYRRYHKRVYGYCLARLMDTDAAADAAQEVFLRLLNSTTEHVDNPTAWIFAVARSATVDAMRKRMRTPDADEIDPDAGDASLTSADTAATLLDREDARNVFLALRRLRPRYRTALILRELHHQSAADMAEALDSTPGAVDTLVSRARDAFGRTYAEVIDLPETCRTSVAAIYKQQGSGLDESEALGLQAHLDECPRCRSEAAKASRPEGMAALLPFLVPGKGVNIFERAMLAVRGIGDHIARVSTMLSPEQASPAGKVAIALIAAALITAPIASTVRTGQQGSNPPVHAVASAAAGNSGSRRNTAASSGSSARHAPTSSQMRGSQIMCDQWWTSQYSAGSMSKNWSSGSSWTSTSKSGSWSGTSRSGSWSGSSGSRSSSSGSRSGSWSGSSGGSHHSSSSGSSGGHSWSGGSGMSSGGSRSSGSWSGSSRW